jgi:hypothetical protein
MAIGNIPAGGTGVLALSLMANGSPYTPPQGSTYAFTPALTCDDTSVTITPGTDAVTFNVAVALGDANASATFTASATDPDGGTATGSITIPLVAAKFTIQISQTA